MNINATLLGQTFAFVIFVAICWRYIWPPIIAIMQEREQRITDGLEAAKKANDSLEEAKLNSIAELEKAKQEATVIIEKANQRASQIVSDAQTKAETEAEKIVAASSKTLEAEISKTREELRKDVSEIIISTAEKILEEEISKDKHEKIILEAAKKI